MIDRYLAHIAKGRLPIFSFHKVPSLADPLYPQEVDLYTYTKTIDFIAEHFHIISLSEAIKKIKDGKNLPAGAACITFDDGYSGWLERVIPTLEAHSAHATFYITTGQLKGTPMWHERIYQCVAACTGKEIYLPDLGLPPLPTKTLSDKKKTLITFETHLKHKSLSIRERFISDFEKLVGVHPDNLPVMSASEIREIHNRGFSIGSHSVNHPILTQCSEREALFEIGACKEELEALIGAKVDHFAYPNGRPYKDYDHTHVEIVRHCGYESAVTTSNGISNIAQSIYQIPRFTPWGPSQLKMTLQTIRNLHTNSQQVS